MVWILLAALALLVVLTIVMYNRLVAMRNDVKNLWRQIDVQLKRRYDLIPNLVEAVKGVMEFEKDTLERVVNARSRAVNAKDPASRAQADADVTTALTGLYAVVERYPELQSNQNVRQLQADLTTTENAIASVRSSYNTSVRDYQNMRESVPSNIVAGLFNFQEEAYFEAAEQDRAVPKVSLR